MVSKLVVLGISANLFWMFECFYFIVQMTNHLLFDISFVLFVPHDFMPDFLNGLESSHNSLRYRFSPASGLLYLKKNSVAQAIWRSFSHFTDPF